MFFENAFHNLRSCVNDRLEINTEKRSNENFRTKRNSSRLNSNYDFNNKNLKNRQAEKREEEKVIRAAEDDDLTRT